jgi:hypothetical protein
MQAPAVAQVPHSHRCAGLGQFIDCSTLDCEAADSHGPTRMTFVAIIALLPALLGFAGAQSTGDVARVRSVIIEDQVIMRVPVRPHPRRDWAWTEHKGPKCISTEDIRGAMLVGREHIDFMMFDRQRIRAELSNDCPALDFYGGFYLNTDDARVCAGRDEVRSREGSSCGIDRFRRLVRRPR